MDSWIEELFRENVGDDINVVDEGNSSTDSTGNNKNESEKERPRDDHEIESSVSKRKVRTTKRTVPVPWTKDEHRLFLMGLNKFGKGNWMRISAFYVQTKTPRQVASHAQKFFSRQKSISSTPHASRRRSINDIKSVNNSTTNFFLPRQMNFDQPPLSLPVSNQPDRSLLHRLSISSNPTINFAVNNSTINFFQPSQMNFDQPPQSPSVSNLPDDSLPPLPPSIDYPIPLICNVDQNPTIFPSIIDPFFEPETMNFPVTIPIMDPQMDIPYPARCMFLPSTSTPYRS